MHPLFSCRVTKVKVFPEETTRPRFIENNKTVSPNCLPNSGASGGTRTPDVLCLLTREVLSPLSHTSVILGAGNGIRTHDNQFGKLELYL